MKEGPTLGSMGEIENLALSYVRLDGNQNFYERFFLEDLAIGRLRPVFNVDSER